MTTVDPITVVPLYIEVSNDGKTAIGNGTGFIISKGGKSYLFTNKHVVTGRYPDTNGIISKTGAVDFPYILIWYHAKDRLGMWYQVSQEIRDNDTGVPYWIGHPTNQEYDVVAVPLNVPENVTLFPLDMSLSETDLVVYPSEPMSIVGFPFGRVSDGKFPIWKTGHLASDMDINYGSKPVFLIDAMTKEGMSGSPVMARRIGMVTTSRGVELGKNGTKFLGIYAGRLNYEDDKDINIGRVWKAETIKEILEKL
ncbi:MAG: serine protease [bacterium]|nr:serine protease [bacterium]